jgi:CubicO group peptidase (beta-lactamase class C family)
MTWMISRYAGMRRALFVLAAISAIAVPAGAQPAAPPHAHAADASAAERIQRIESGELVPLGPHRPPLRLDLRRLMSVFHVPGLSIAVIDGSQIAWTRGYGVTEAGTKNPVTAHTLFQAGSVSKTVAATGAMALVERGTLALDDDVNGKLTSWKVPENAFTVQQKVTLRRILSHTAGVTVHGFDGYPIAGPVPTLRQILDGEKPATNPPVRVDLVPGTKWRYSGGAVEIEQQLMMDATGMPFPALMRALVLDETGMTDSTFEQPLPPDRAGAAAAGTHADGETIAGRWEVVPQLAAAGLWTTPTDLAKFAIAIAAAKRGTPGGVVSPATARTMLTPVVDVEEIALGNEQHRDRIGLGFFLGDATRPDLFGHIGDDPGFQAMLMMFADSGKGVAVMANSENGILLGDYLIERIAKEYDWNAYVPASRPRIGAAAVLLAVFEQDGLVAALDAYEQLKLESLPRYSLTQNSAIALGYAVSAAGKPADAITVMKLAVRDNPQYWNAYDSLGEMYANVGNRARAIENYERSVQLNPQNAGGIEALRKLRGP